MLPTDDLRVAINLWGMALYSDEAMCGDYLYVLCHPGRRAGEKVFAETCAVCFSFN
jgi:hypothetical protein